MHAQSHTAEIRQETSKFLAREYKETLDEKYTKLDQKDMSSNTTTNTTTTNTTTTGPPYEDVTIPFWGFNSSCDWLAALKVDLTISSVAVIYNAIIAMLPLLIERMYSMQGAVISSHTLAVFLVSIYNVIFDSRLLQSSKEQNKDEKYISYLLIWFLSYHCMFHMHLLSWDQHHAVIRFNAHRRFASRSKLIRIKSLVWISAIVASLLEAFFIFNPRNYPDQPQVHQFRLIVLLLFMIFFWIGPMVLVLSWNGKVFSFLLKVIHNGFIKKTPPENPERYDRDESPKFTRDVWSGMVDDEIFYEDPPEYATLPDDINYHLSQSFFNFVMVTTLATIMMLWFGYHVLAIFRTSEVLLQYKLYEVIYRCELYISLYTAAKLILMLNPVWYFYYRKEMFMPCTVKSYGVTHE